MTPSETLRSAAKLMRECADAATPGPWKHMCLGSEGCLVIRDSGTIRERGHGRVARFGCKDWQADHADAEFVASMSPVAVLPLARWLEFEARVADGDGEEYLLNESGRLALATARAYLAAGES
jgi:hypothetical protein